MRLSSPSIQRLLNASERTLVAQASSANVKELSAARLRGKVERARRLKDKYAGLARARGRVGRGKAQPKGARPRTDIETMAAKAAVFEEVLSRFSGHLQKLEKQAARATSRPAARKKAKTAVAKVRKRVARQAGAPADAIADMATSDSAEAETNSAVERSRGAKASRVKQTLAVSHMTRAQAHVGARTQRRQGRRDSK